MDDYQDIYRRKTPLSASLYRRAEQLMPGGVSHNLRYNDPYPPCYRRGEGAYFEDVDGNRYLDFWMGHYANILGHAPPLITGLLERLLAEGVMHCGLVNEYEVRLAQLICELVPAAEQVRFCVSGTEAAMYALRLARAYTGRDLVIKIEGGWHGANDDLLLAVSPPYDARESLGLDAGLGSRVFCLRFNDVPGARELIRRCGERLAAVIVEPVVGVGGFIPATPEFLELLRRETEACGALLIFDEIISGFRVALGGAQELLGVVPDVVLLGKVLGGGMPVGAIAGRRRIMDRANPRLYPDKSRRAAVGGGTFSCSPLAMAAGVKMLEYLKEHAASVYPALAAAGERVRHGLERVFARAGVRVLCSGVGSLFMTHFPKQPGLRIDSPYAGNCLTDVEKREKELKGRLLAKGVYVMHGGGAISLAHRDEDLERFLELAEEVAFEMAGERVG